MPTRRPTQPLVIVAVAVVIIGAVGFTLSQLGAGPAEPADRGHGDVVWTGAGGGRYELHPDIEAAPTPYTDRLEIMAGRATARVGRQPLEMVFPGGEMRVVRGAGMVDAMRADAPATLERLAALGVPRQTQELEWVTEVALLRGIGTASTDFDICRMRAGEKVLIVTHRSGRTEIVKVTKGNDRKR